MTSALVRFGFVLFVGLLSIARPAAFIAATTLFVAGCDRDGGLEEVGEEIDDEIDDATDDK